LNVIRSLTDFRSYRDRGDKAKSFLVFAIVLMDSYWHPTFTCHLERREKSIKL
jgi:hypothetical protein